MKVNNSYYLKTKIKSTIFTLNITNGFVTYFDFSILQP